jgi:hypothetical protein
MGQQTAIPITGKDRLSYVTLVLFIKRFAMFDRCQSPLINVQLKVCDNPCCLASLPVHKVEQNLLLACHRVFLLNSSSYLLGEQFIYTERAGCPLPIKPFCRTVVKVGVIHLFLSFPTMPIVVLQGGN